MTLPLSDRLLLPVQAAPRSARALSRALGADVHDVHRVLRGLEAQRVVEERPVPCDGSLWRLVPGVRVQLRPAMLEVLRNVPPSAAPSPEVQCRAVGTRGKACSLRAGEAGLCVLHAGRSD